MNLPGHIRSLIHFTKWGKCVLVPALIKMLVALEAQMKIFTTITFPLDTDNFLSEDSCISLSATSSILGID
jgi:hypothetical protein